MDSVADILPFVDFSGLSFEESISRVQLPFSEPHIYTREVLFELLKHAFSIKAEDVFLSVGYPASVMWSEGVHYLGTRPLHYQELGDLLNDMLKDDNARLDLSRGSDRDFTYAIEIDRGTYLRFRVNVTGCLGPWQSDGLDITFRPMGKCPPTLDELGIPIELQNILTPKIGLILVCGPTGSGKTTLLDSTIRKLATQPNGRRILTYYQPIENDLHAIPNQTGVIAQTEINEFHGGHLQSFGLAGRNALRRHPHVIVYGEARDRETIDAAVTSARTGHLVFTTTHTLSVDSAIPRMADEFGENGRVRITNALITSCRGIVHQRLLRRPTVGRAPVRSWLEMTQDIRSELIRTPIDALPRTMAKFVKERGRSLWDDACSQYEKGLIHDDEMVMLESEIKEEEASHDR